MSLMASSGGAPEAKKFRLSVPTQVVVERPIFTCSQPKSLSESSSGAESPNTNVTTSSSPLISSIKSSLIKDDNEDTDVCSNDNYKSFLPNGQSLVDVLSTAMMFQANLLLKQQQHQSQQHRNHHQKLHHQRTPRSSIGGTTSSIPGALAVAASPTAALFSEDDWSWHRNPAAAIRSGGTNKQTPVWKYFVYNKAENLSRCIVGDCTYMLKGPHTSTLACHLKKHPAEYAEFQKLKLEYTRDRNGNHMASSPASSASGSGSGTYSNSVRPRSSFALKTNKLHTDSSQTNNAVLNLSKQMPLDSLSNRVSNNNNNTNMSNILNVLNARANAAALASGNAHLVNNPMSALISQNNPTKSDCNSNVSNNNSTSDNNHNDNTNNDNSSANIISSNNPPSHIQTTYQSVPLQNSIFNNVGLLAESASVIHPTAVITPSPTTILSNNAHKWSREERKQKEMETKLALMLSATQLPTNIIENSFFRDFIEFAQPKFSLPDDINYIEEIINTEYSRLLLTLKNQLNASKKVSIMIDVLKLCTTPSSSASTTSDDKESKDVYSKDSENSDSGFDVSSDENPSVPGSPRTRGSSGATGENRDESRSIIRLCVSAAYFSALTKRTEIVLLGIRPIIEESDMLGAIRSAIAQVLSDFEISSDKVSRYLTNGVTELVGSNFEGEIFPRMLEPYSQKLMKSLLKVIDANGTIEELKKSLYSMVLNFVTRQDAMEQLQQIAGRAISLPIADSFLVLMDAVLELKDPLLYVCSQFSPDNSIESLTEQQWQMLEGVSRLLRLFRSHTNIIRDSKYVTIDYVIPSLLQLQLSLNKDFASLGDLMTQLKDELRTRTSSIFDVSSSDFDGSFIQATALNHHFVSLLNNEQFNYAKSAIQRQLNDRLRSNDDVVSRRSMKLNGCVDALLAAVQDRNNTMASSSNSTTLFNNIISDNNVDINSDTDHNDNNANANISTNTLCMATTSASDNPLDKKSSPTATRPDLAAVANERCELMTQDRQQHQQIDGKHRNAEAIVVSYFDDVMSASNVANHKPLSLSSSMLSPLQFWHFNSTKYGQLCDVAVDLLTIPSSTTSLERIFSNDQCNLSTLLSTPQPSSSTNITSNNNTFQQFDPMSLLKSIDDTERMERDVMLRFNRSLIAKV